ncbi:ABC transporter substrate-binding protein [Azospirillum oleiclasticum]
MAKPSRNRIALLASTMLFGVLAAGPALAQSAVKIGCALPLSGGSATVGNQTRAGALAAAEQINAAGGIKALNGAKLEVVFGDTQSKADIGVTETERLVTRENVAALCGAFNSAVTFPATEVAERYKTPWVVVGSVKDEITERNFKYVFRINNKATYDAREQLDALDLLAKETGKKPKTIAMLYEGSDWGRSHAANVKRFAKDRGYDIVLDEAAPPNQVDFSNQLLKIRGARPDAVIVALYTPDHLLFSRQLMEQRLDLPFGIHSVGGGTEDPAFYKGLPQRAVDYVFVQEDWQIDKLQQTNDKTILAIAERTKEMLGYGMSAYAAQGASAMYVLADALERSGSTDREKLRDAIAASDIQSGPALITGYGRIKFDEQGQNTHAHGVISQNLNGQRRTIWPLENRGSETKPVWPVPAWSERKGS